MRAAALLLVLSVSLPAAAAEDRMVNAWTIAGMLSTPRTQWVFNHICLPTKALEGKGFTLGHFVEAYFIVSQLRWEAALEALAKDDEKESMQSLALILHGMIDSYWPGRVARDAEGAITQFRDCDELGNLQGMLREERSGSGPNAVVGEEVTKLMSQVIRAWKERKPFADVAPVLRSGPMKINASTAAQPLTAK